MELLNVKDFNDTKFDPNWSCFDYLLEVARIGQEKMQKQNFKICNGEEKKRHDFGYLKSFLYNAPQPQAICKEDNMSFKKGKSLKKNVGLKRKHKLKLKEEDEDEDEDEEWERLKLKRNKKGKPVGLNPPVPDLPENFKQHIVEKMGGSDLVLVIQKSLFFSDVNPQASRFAMPFSQLKTHEFLNKTETEDLKDVTKAIKVCLLEPSMKENRDITFKRWNMNKCSTYVMNGAWNSVVESNGLKIDDIVQLWSFRVKSDLCFALVKFQSNRN